MLGCLGRRWSRRLNQRQRNLPIAPPTSTAVWEAWGGSTQFCKEKSKNSKKKSLPRSKNYHQKIRPPLLHGSWIGPPTHPKWGFRDSHKSPPTPVIGCIALQTMQRPQTKCNTIRTSQRTANEHCADCGISHRTATESSRPAPGRWRPTRGRSKSPS